MVVEETFLEALEPRIAPASMTSAFVGATTLGSSVSTTGDSILTSDWAITGNVSLSVGPTLGRPHIIDESTLGFTDIDGDIVTVKFSEGILDSLSTVESIFEFESTETLSSLPEGLMVNVDPAGWTLLTPELAHQLFNWSPVITGTNHFLKSLDLTSLDAKDLRRLDVSITAEQSGTGNGVADVGFLNFANIDMGTVTVDGALGKIVAGDANLKHCGLIELNVGSLGFPEGAAPTNLDDITSVITGNLRRLDVTGSIAGALLKVTGGEGVRLDNVHIGGSVIGGAEDSSGAIISEGKIGRVLIEGSIKGGNGEFSGLLQAFDGIRDAVILDDLVGGSAERAGLVSGIGGIERLEIHGNIIGGSAYGAGRVESVGKLGKLILAGNIEGGSDQYAGSVYSTETISGAIIDGDLVGTDKRGTGAIFSDECIRRLEIHGNLIGGTGEASGYVQAQVGFKAIEVVGDLLGSSGKNSGSILCFDGKLGRVDHEGTATPGSGAESGKIASKLQTSSNSSYGTSMSYGGVLIVAVGPDYVTPSPILSGPSYGATYVDVGILSFIPSIGYVGNTNSNPLSGLSYADFSQPIVANVNQVGNQFITGWEITILSDIGSSIV